METKNRQPDFPLPRVCPKDGVGTPADKNPILTYINSTPIASKCTTAQQGKKP